MKRTVPVAILLCLILAGMGVPAQFACAQQFVQLLRHGQGKIRADGHDDRI